MHSKLKFWQQAANQIISLEFEFQTLSEVNAIVAYLDQWFPEKGNVGLGLKELMVNAIEHGNLGIGYDFKTKLLRRGVWLQEVEARILNPKHAEKRAYLRVKISPSTLKFIIQDQGEGFDVRQFMRQNHDNDLHGRGLLLAKNMAFDKLRFKNKGSRIEATVTR